MLGVCMCVCAAGLHGEALCDEEVQEMVDALFAAHDRDFDGKLSPLEFCVVRVCVCVSEMG